MLLEGRKKKTKAKLSAKGFVSFLYFFLFFLSHKQFVNKKEDDLKYLKNKILGIYSRFPEDHTFEEGKHTVSRTGYRI